MSKPKEKRQSFIINKAEDLAIDENMTVDAKNEDIERTKKLEEDKLEDEIESSAKAEEILKQINGSSSKNEVAGRAGFTSEEISKYGIKTDEENERAVKTTNEQLKNYTDAQKIENEKTQEQVSESEKIDPVALNNRIVNMPHQKQQEAIDNLTQEEIRAVAKNIAKGNFDHTLDFLNNFKNKPEIISQPEIIDKFKKALAGGNVHLYDVDRILSLHGTEEVFNDPEVQKGVQNSVRSFVSYQNSSEWPHVSGAIDRVVKGANIDNQGLRNIAEEIKGNNDAFHLFIRQFGIKRIYPEL